jgi:hypothetical protein
MSARFPTINSGVINASECISEGKALIDDRYWQMVGICFVGYLIAGSGPFYILYGPMICGIYYCTLALKRGEPMEFGDLFKGFGFFGPAFLAGLIQMLPIFIIAVPFYVVWMFAVVLRPHDSDAPAFLFPVFGIFYVALLAVSLVMHLLCAFSFPLVVEWKMSGWDAFKTSVEGIRANLGGAIGLTLLCGLILLGGALLCGVGMYLVLPITHAAWTIAYRKVFSEYEPHLDVPPFPPKWREWTGNA